MKSKQTQSRIAIRTTSQDPRSKSARIHGLLVRDPPPRMPGWSRPSGAGSLPAGPRSLGAHTRGRTCAPPHTSRPAIHNRCYKSGLSDSQSWSGSASHWCVSGSDLKLWCGSGSWFLFDADPDPDFYLMRMRIRVSKMMRIQIHNTVQAYCWIWFWLRIS